MILWFVIFEFGLRTSAFEFSPPVSSSRLFSKCIESRDALEGFSLQNRVSTSLALSVFSANFKSCDIQRFLDNGSSLVKKKFTCALKVKLHHMILNRKTNMESVEILCNHICFPDVSGFFNTIILLPAGRTGRLKSRALKYANVLTTFC